MSLDEKQLVSLNLVDDSLVVPRGHDGLHVEVRGEEANDAIRHDGRHVCEQRAVVPDHSRVLACLELGRQCYLRKREGYYITDAGIPSKLCSSDGKVSSSRKRQAGRTKLTHLIIALRDDHGEDTLTSQRHGEARHDDRVEVEHAGIHVERGQRTRRDDHRLEALDHRPDCNGGVQAPGRGYFQTLNLNLLLM